MHSTIQIGKNGQCVSCDSVDYTNRFSNSSKEYKKMNILVHHTTYCNYTIFCCILISRFSYVENSLHFNLMDFLLSKFLSYYCLHITQNTAYHSPEVVIFYADKFMVMGNFKNPCVFNFAISLKSRKFDVRKIYVFIGETNFARKKSKKNHSDVKQPMQFHPLVYDCTENITAETSNRYYSHKVVSNFFNELN